MDDIQEDDYKVYPYGRLGGKTGVSQGDKFLGEYNETDDALRFVAEHMDETQCCSNIWWVSDHGNYWQIDINGNEIKQDEEE